MTIPVVHQAPRNPRAAAENRRFFDASGIICLNLLGATGCGKTSLLGTILPRIQTELNVGVIEAALATTCDAQRIAELGVPVVQVLTDGQCHLAANQVQLAMTELPLAQLDLLIIENLGSPICQAQNDLGEHLRVAVLSVCGGHRAAAKYLPLFRSASLILLSKYDLLPHVDFDLEGAVRSLNQANPGAEIICTDVKRRVGIDRAAGWLLGYVRAQRLRQRRLPRIAQPARLPAGCFER
jgi:hydrogenase nickel incorporation protein HypB